MHHLQAGLKGIAGSIFLIALLLAAQNATAQNATPPRTVNVSGQGEVRSEPDRALVTLGVEARRPKTEEARAEVARTVDAVLKLTRDLKIDPRYVHATRITLQPEYNWNAQDRERVLLGYFVARQVQVELRNLDQLGSLLERAVDIG